jgi:hypothetical protein
MIRTHTRIRAHHNELTVCVSMRGAERVELGVGQGRVDGGVAEEGTS